MQSVGHVQILTCEKRGHWWLPSALNLAAAAAATQGVSSKAGSLRSRDEARLLKLASAQRMNTDSRRAVFCVLMSADDHVRLNSVFAIFALFHSFQRCEHGLHVQC